MGMVPPTGGGFVNGLSNAAHSIGNWAMHPQQQTTQALTNLGRSGANMLGNVAGNTMSKFAPLLGLPIMYGLMSGNDEPQQQQGYQSPFGTNYIQPNYMGPVNPSGFKTAGLIVNPVKAIQSKIIGDALYNKDKKDSTVKSEGTIKGKNQETKELLADPSIKDYVHELINN